MKCIHLRSERKRKEKFTTEFEIDRSQNSQGRRRQERHSSGKFAFRKSKANSVAANEILWGLKGHFLFSLPAAQSTQRLQFDSPWTVVGVSHHDYGGLWRHSPQDVPGHDRGHALCLGRRVDRSAARAGHRLQLCYVLLPHPSARQTA